MSLLARTGALLLLLCAGAAQAAISIAARSFVDAPTLVNPAVFYTDSGAGIPLRCNYQAFAISSSTVETSDVWARIENFGGGNLALGGGDDGLVQLGGFAAGQIKTAYFYVCSSYSVSNGVVTGQTYDVKVYDRKPTLPSPGQLGTRSFSLTIDNSVIQAGTNQVSTIVAGPNPPVLGGIITLTVEGDTGNIGNAPGSNGPLAFTAAAYTTWRADAYELVASTVTFTGGNSGSFSNQLYFAGLANGGDTHYVVTFSFRAVTTTITPTSLSPVGYIASGAQVKHTDTTKGAYNTGLLLIDGATNTLTLTKLVNAATLPISGGTVSYTLRLSNSSAYAISVDSIVDSLPTSPASATYVSSSSTFNGVAQANPSISGNVLTWGGPFSIPAGGVRDLVFQATIPATAGLYTNSAIGHIGATVIDTTLTTTDNAPATAQTRVLLAPVIAKSFTPTATAVGGVLQLSITLSNPNSANALSGVAFTDTYGGSLVNSATPNATTTCSGGTLTGGVAGLGSIGIGGVALAAGASCTVTVNVTSSSATAATNTTGAVTSINAGTGNTANAAYAFTAQPTLTKTFAPTVIAPGGTSTMTIVVTNNSASNLTGLAFSDTFPLVPAGLAMAATPASSNTCGGGLTGATAGSTLLNLASGAITLPATTCQISVNVTAPTGIYPNTTSGATSNIPGTGPPSNTATLTVNLPPTVAKAFSPATISRNGTSLLTITLTNSNASAITGAAFTDTYPIGVPSGALVNATPPAGTTTCGAGAVTATAGGGSVALSGATIPANGSCSVTVNVTSSTAASYPNNIPSGGVTTTNAASNSVTAEATLIVSAAPSVLKSFSANPATGINTLTVVITNNHTAGITGVGFSDTFPAGLSVAATPAATNSCAGTFSAAANATSISLSGAAIAGAGASCTVSVSVVAASAGLYNNQTSGVASNIGTGNPSNVAILIAPALTKAFSPTVVGPGDPATMTLTVTNPSLTVALTGVQFDDSYPANLRNVSASILSNSCGGTATASPNATNPGTLTLTGAGVPAGGSCSVSVNVSAPIGAIVPTSYYNQSGTVRSSQGVGIDAADTLYVTNRPTIAKTFSGAVGGPGAGTFATASTILLGQSSTLRLIIENNHTANLSGISFSDALPAGMTVTSPSVTSNTCGGTLSAAANATTISLSGGTFTGVTPTGICTITVNVTATSAGSYLNQTSGVVSTTVSPNPGPPSNAATLTVNLNPPTVNKSFTPNIIALNGTSTITVTLNNPNASAITGASFTDIFPPGLTTSGTPVATTTCGPVLVSAPAGGNTLNVSSATIAGGGACVVTVPVTASVAGNHVNPSFTVSTANAGNVVSATALLAVYAAPTVAKSFSPASITSGGTSVLTLTVTNPSANPGTVSGITVRDVFPTAPGAMTLANTSIATNTCGGMPTNQAGAPIVIGSVGVQLTGVSLGSGASASCSVTFNVTAAATGTYTNTTDAITATVPIALTGATANAALTVGAAAAPNLALTKTHSGNFVVGATHAYLLTVNNNLGTAATSGTITVVDTLPSGLSYVAAGSGGTTWTCGVSGQLVTCTSSAVIAASATSANPITINVAVGAAAQPSVTNSATVSGGGEPGANTGNNTALDYTVVVAAPVNSFLSDGVQIALPASVVFYAHQFIAGSDGSVLFSTANVPSPAIAGWTHIIYRDTNCNGVLDGAEGATPLLSAVSVLAGVQICIVVKEFVPAAAPLGAQDQITVTAAFTPTVGTPQSLTRTDLTTVGNPGLTLAKAVRVLPSGAFGINNSALPGQVLEYQITYTNTGSGALSNLVINDATPSFTTFVSASCGVPPLNISGCATTQPSFGGVGGIAWTLSGSLAPGSQSTVLFQVTVQP